MHERALFGLAGEDLAARHLEERGFAILDRNFRSGRGEVDLVLRKGALVVFCEVKTRRTDRWGQPSEAVDHRKRTKLRRLAAAWLEQHRVGHVDLRFDVVSIVADPAGIEPPRLTHIEAAF